MASLTHGGAADGSAGTSNIAAVAVTLSRWRWLMLEPGAKSNAPVDEDQQNDQRRLQRVEKECPFSIRLHAIARFGMAIIDMSVVA